MEGSIDFPCDLCDKTFKRKYHLQRHRDVIHYGLRKIACHICHKVVNDKDFLYKHIRNVHTKKCDFCPETFETRDELRLHSEEHRK